MIKVYISPDYTGQPEHVDRGGIRRVVEAMMEHLHKFDVEVVHNPDEADVICNHGTSLIERPGIPSVSVSHGLYWSRQPWGDGYKEVNEMLVETMTHAVAHTAPSQWVANAIRRGGYWYPEVVYHGVNAKEFKPSKKNGEYILWNKARADYVSDPQDMMNLADSVPNRTFWSTIGHTSQNVKITGVLPHNDIKRIVAEAGLFLSTARETFGIGTLEAMAYGVPVIGWDWGGNSEIIRQGETGYLAPPGDYKVLAEMVELAFSERSRLSRNCIEDVRQNWKWEPRVQQYADIFKRVYAARYSNNPRVSVIVTAYKLDQYLPQCLDSVLAQTFKDFECLVVDDAPLTSTRMIVENYAKLDRRIRYLPTPNNFGLVGARNFGVVQSAGNLIRHVDADDWLAENALELEVQAADIDPGTHIFYGHIGIANEDGSIRQERSGWPDRKFNWFRQMAHLNQLPSCAMVRREVYERSGGYRERMKRNEDAEFWCRVTSLGFRARKFTEAVTYFHRDRPNSKGATEWQNEGQEPDWTAWFPWRMGSNDYRSARSVYAQYGDSNPHTNIVPFGAQGKPTNIRFWHVHDFAYPVVSIIVTVGPGHKPYLLDALDSIQAQKFIDWECIVVNDTGEKWDKNIMGAPWAKVVNMDGNRGAAAARNEGLKHAKGKYVIWLDGDDYWFPWTLERMVAYAENNDGVIYSDFLMDKGVKPLTTWKYMDFEPQFLSKGCAMPGSSILIPKKYADKISWDEGIAGLEDWDYQYALCDADVCFFHIPEPLFVYRMYASTKRDADYAKIEEIQRYLDSKWNKYRVEGKKLMCSCTKKTTPSKLPPRSSLSSSGNFAPSAIAPENPNASDTTFVQIEYMGDVEAPFRLTSIIDRSIMYRFSARESDRIKNVYYGDLKKFNGLLDKLGRPLFRVTGVPSDIAVDDPAAFLNKEVSA